jgi:hypothetical protein
MRNAVIVSLLALLLGSFSCGGQKGTENRSKSNSPPVVTSATLLPERPTKESELSSSVQGHDPDGDPMTYQYQWIRNDEDLVGEKKEVLKAVNLRKGDLIRVRVTPADGKAEGKPFLSEPVRILNSPPVIEEVRIEPKIAYADDLLKAQVKGFDADGDFIQYTYRWERNGAPLSEGGGESLKPGQLKKGDSVFVVATPDDRETNGLPKKSEPVVIANSPPMITSAPSTRVDGTAYLYQVKAHDSDGDPIQFALKAGPKGMTIDKETGLIRWEIRKDDKGTYPIEVEASDNEGAKSVQRYTLTVDFR